MSINKFRILHWFRFDCNLNWYVDLVQSWHQPNYLSPLLHLELKGSFHSSTIRHAVIKVDPPARWNKYKHAVLKTWTFWTLPSLIGPGVLALPISSWAARPWHMRALPLLASSSGGLSNKQLHISLLFHQNDFPFSLRKIMSDFRHVFAACLIRILYLLQLCQYHT